jgi:hypothetical protein
MFTSQLNPGLLEQLSAIAEQFGPFFFALLFIIFVPAMGQKYFANFLKQRASRGQERAVALEAYTFYWKTGIVTGLILVVISVWWYIYVKMHQIQIRNTSVFEAVIRGIQDDDDFVLDPGFKDYSAYYYRVPDIRPPVMKVAIVFRANSVTGPTVELHYMNRRTYAAKQKDGGILHAIPFCLRYQEVQLIHESADKPPRFDRVC